MLVKDFIAASSYDYIDIVMDGQLVESYDKEDGTYQEQADPKM